MSLQPNTRQRELSKRTGKPHIYVGHLNLPERPHTPVLMWFEIGPHRITRHDYRNMLEIERAWFDRRAQP